MGLKMKLMKIKPETFFKWALIIGLLTGIFAWTVLLCGCVSYDWQCHKSPFWAKQIQIKGVPNLYKVSDDLYRSAQPTAEGMGNLKSMGIKTIVNLRAFHSDYDEMGCFDFGYERIYMKPWRPEEEDAVRFLQIVTDPAKTPVLVHCQHGADRTGIMVALYRVAVEGWAKEVALCEMTQGGFGFHSVWNNLIGWFGELDVEGIKEKAGMIKR